MNLDLYNAENELRKTYSKVTDEHLIKWRPLAQSTFKCVPSTDPGVIVPTNSKSTGFVDQRDVNRRFQLLTHGVLNYINWDNVVAAGGVVSNTINAHTKCEPSDVDLFIHSIDDVIARLKIEELINDISQYCSDNYGSTPNIIRNKYTVSLVLKRGDNCTIKVQIILRLYKCIYEILAGFDVDSCAVAYDGHNIFLTARSLNAFQTRMNVVDLSRRSPSYEHRLHKYAGRGFGIYAAFDWNKYNRLYFLNRHTKGLDRLLIYQRYNRRPGLQKLLNYITKRRNIKFSAKPVSDYESGDLELELGKKEGLRLTIARYNQRVTEPFKYTLYYSLEEFNPDLLTVEFITHNPGQQLTGSFHPITDGDWVLPDYTQFGVDFLGRSVALQKIKDGTALGTENDLEALYEITDRDNSLFNVLEYLIMYNNNEELVTKAWDNRHRFQSNGRNLYGFNQLTLAMIYRRYTLVQHIMAKEQENMTRNNEWRIYIELALFLDDLTLLKGIYRYYKNSIYDQRDNVKKYRCVEIGKHFGLKLESEDRSLVAKLAGHSADERLETVLNNNWASAGEFGQLLMLGDYQRFTNEELRYYSHRAGGDVLWSQVMKDARRKVVPDKTYFNDYPQNTFEHWWYDYCLLQKFAQEERKDPERSKRAWEILTQMFPREQVEAVQEVTFYNPVERLDAKLLVRMRRIWTRKPETVNLWSDYEEPIRGLLFALDDYDHLLQYLEERHMGGFLGKYKSDLGPNLYAKWEEFRAQQVSLNTELHRKFATPLCNTTAHLNVLETGELAGDCTVENVFGQTAYDYAFGQLMYLWDCRSNLEDIQLDQLANLRQGTTAVDRSKAPKRCTLEMAANPDLEALIERI